MCLGLLPATALAADAVSYVEYSWNGSKLTEEATTPVTDYTTLSGNINNTTWGAGWYMVSGTVTVNNNRDSTVTVSGTVNLILPQGSKLDLSYGTISISDGGTLNIYGQETGSGTLTLGGNHRDANPGIGLGSGSTLNIHGGTVNATAIALTRRVRPRASTWAVAVPSPSTTAPSPPPAALPVTASAAAPASG